MLRLGMGDRRLKVEGQLGGAIYLLTMAEMLRRAAEDAFDRELPEEDELGFGWAFPDAKKNIYGAIRILDGDRDVAAEFVRHLQLDYGLRVRWYVEGETEFGALVGIFHKFGPSGVEIINIRGQFGRRAGQSFRDSLRADVRAHIFSLVTIDGDRSGYLRVVRGAAEADEIYGAFFVSQPDFEFGNFTRSELEELLWEAASECGAGPDTRATLHQAVEGANSGKELLTRARRAIPALTHFSKSEYWGERLMKFARLHPQWTTGDLRPIIKAVGFAVRGTYANYNRTRSQHRVDPLTGLPIDRL